LPLDPGQYVKIAVADQGHGIQPENLNKIFDPYFTTKPKGSGLGLAVVYSIIKRHNGYITVDSVINKGTTFTFYLPALGRQSELKKKSSTAFSQGQGKVLVMDDEEGIRKIIGAILEKAGYTVHYADNGDQTLAVYNAARREKEPFDVVILDLVVPAGMGGKETMGKLLSLHPEVKAIVCSGYSNDPVMAHYKQYGFKEVLVKPFNPDELTRIVKKVLSA
jgi:two-component system, cell cycle sensor histidine kinase and response regulator CckA